ncbi:hypothetical protein SLA2020_087830 [Shorea laevis]
MGRNLTNAVIGILPFPIQPLDDRFVLDCDPGSPITINFRQERWQWGAREDWRFADMSRQYEKQWWWISFFAVYVSQQVFLIGVCLPLYAVHAVDKPLDIWDFVAAAVCLCGIVIAYFADTQLHDFVTRNQKLKEIGKPLVANLERGLWHMCLVYVTVLVEQRMLKQDYRAEAYRLYQKTTSAWIPWFKSSAIAVKNKST